MTGSLWAALHRRLRARAYAKAGQTPPPEAAEGAAQGGEKRYTTAEEWAGFVKATGGKMPQF